MVNKDSLISNGAMELFYSDGSNTVIAESDTTKKDIKEDFSVFDIDREIICFVDNKNPNIHLMNWKNGEKISDLYPINPSIELRLDFDKDHLFSLEEQIDGQRYHIYNIKTQKHELLCEQFEFHRFLDISKNSEFPVLHSMESRCLFKFSEFSNGL